MQIRGWKNAVIMEFFALGIRVAKIFDWGGSKAQILSNDVIRNFREIDFSWDKDIVDWKIRSRGLFWNITKILLKEEGLNQK